MATTYVTEPSVSTLHLERTHTASAVLDGVVIRVPSGQSCHCGRFRRPSDIEKTGHGLRMLCGRCHDLAFEIEFES
jgi:hypothetical protein